MVFVVHGEDETCEDFTSCLNEEHQIPACAPFSGSLYDLAEGVWIKEGEPVLVTPEKPAAKRKSDVFTRLLEAGKRLIQGIYHNEGSLPCRLQEPAAWHNGAFLVLRYFIFCYCPQRTITLSGVVCGGTLLVAAL